MTINDKTGIPPNINLLLVYNPSLENKTVAIPYSDILIKSLDLE